MTGVGSNDAVHVLNDQYIVKPPGAGDGKTRFAWHRDGQYRDDTCPSSATCPSSDPCAGSGESLISASADGALPMWQSSVPACRRVDSSLQSSARATRSAKI